MFLIRTLLLLSLIRITLSSSAEYRLLQYLKENYDYFERPVENCSQALDVKVRLLLNQILDIDEKNQWMSILAYVDYRWSDYKLKWDPARFDGIEDVRFPGGDDAPFKLWKPDVLLFNSVSESFDATFASRYIVRYDGTVQQNPPGIFKFICQVDVTYYPFDSQTCFLKLGSWTYSGNYIDLDFYLSDIIGVKGDKVTAIPQREKNNPQSYYVNESIDLSVYLPNGEWDLINTPGRRVVQQFGSESYHELYFYIHIRRRTLAYGINLIIPSLVISMMTVLGFTLPPDACEKITLETTILLSVIFFLQMVSNMSPPQSKSVPILAAFFSCCLMVVACSCVFTVLSLGLYHRKPETHVMSSFMRSVFVDWLPYLLLMSRANHPKAPKSKILMKKWRKHAVDHINISKHALALPRPSRILLPRIPSIEQHPCLSHVDNFYNELLVIRGEIDKVQTQMDDQQKQNLLRAEWRLAAMAVDRMCLYLFSLFIFISTCGLIIPNIIAGISES